MTDRTKTETAKTKTTPERWTVQAMSLPAHHYVTIYTGDNEIRVLQDGRGKCYVLKPGSRFEQIVNLAAAAPDLLAALEGLFRECAMIHRYGGDADNTRQANDAIKAAEAAIRAARGGR